MRSKCFLTYYLFKFTVLGRIKLFTKRMRETSQLPLLITICSALTRFDMAPIVSDAQKSLEILRMNGEHATAL